MTVQNYMIVVSGDEYTAPELRRFHLQGECSWIQDGSPNKMTSSPIVSVIGNVITTRSGSVYILGKRAEGYSTWGQVRKLYPAVPMD